MQADAFSFLGRQPDRTFDYIYIAPPQYKGMWERAITLLDSHSGWFNSDSWIIVQIDPLEYSQMSLDHLAEFEQRKYGNTMLIFFETKEES
jgi:16S rRNA G966 N2-methylase RsmD